MASYYSYPSRSLVDEMHQIAKELTTPARGLLITDDSPFNMDKQFEMFGIESCEAIRIRYRSMLFSTNNKLNEYVSGVAVHPEVLDHTTPNGCALHCQLRRTNILVGVTVDRGLVPLMCSYGEYTSQGLDGLSGRCEQYKDCGCDFTMWRVQYNVSEFTPSYQALIENANTIAKYAAISQSKRMLPILEVDIIPSEYCDLESLEQIAETVLKYICKSLFDHHVNLEATLLKVPVLNPGPKSEKRSSPGQISRVTLRMLRHAVPFSIGGIILQVDGRTQDKSLCQLNALASDPSPKPWPLTFSCDSVMQSSLMMTWAGQDKNVKKTHEEFLKLLKAFSKASQGTYVSGTMKSLFDQCYCKKTLKYWKLTPPPLSSDCVKFDEICRPPTILAITAKNDGCGESSKLRNEADFKIEDPSLLILQIVVKEEFKSESIADTKVREADNPEATADVEEKEEVESEYTAESEVKKEHSSPVSALESGQIGIPPDTSNDEHRRSSATKSVT